MEFPKIKLINGGISRVHSRPTHILFYRPSHVFQYPYWLALAVYNWNLGGGLVNKH